MWGLLGIPWVILLDIEALGVLSFKVTPGNTSCL